MSTTPPRCCLTFRLCELVSNSRRIHTSFYYLLMLKIIFFSKKLPFIRIYAVIPIYRHSLMYDIEDRSKSILFFLVFFPHSFWTCTIKLLLFLFLFPLFFLLTPSLQISVFSLSVFYPPPRARLALAAPCFLNLSSFILFRSLLGSSNTRSESSYLLSFRSSTNLRFQLELLFSPFFPHPLSGPLYPGPCRSPSLSFSLLSPSRRLAHVHGRPLQFSPSHRLSPLRSDGAAPLAARKKGGPKRTSYFLCSDSDLGGPKWPPMM